MNAQLVVPTYKLVAAISVPLGKSRKRGWETEDAT